ncbi:MAG TPA: hypothetical protein VFT62_01195 [Mycobacteriales bacterium]|nr:hypothetical protein [Mycobacteriales bacterium]
MASSGRRGQPRVDGDERAAAALTGGGPSQLGVNGSMRARDVSRPTPAEVAEAERLVQVSYRPRSTPRPPVHSSAGRGGNSPDAS